MTDYNEEQRKQALREMSEYVDSMAERRERAIEALGPRWVLHLSHAPRRGVYNPMTGARLA